MDCERCGKDLDTHPTVDVSNTDRLNVCQDRAMKWQRVEPGTVIPAGQPYRVERWDTTFGARATEYVDDKPHSVRPRDYPVFVDSSWRPPRTLPTEPTWGLVIWQRKKENWTNAEVGRWQLDGPNLLMRTNRITLDTRCDTIDCDVILRFIPFTPEQVTQLETHR